ncbi:uncharacterized protein LOC142143198 [Mixophyes fleayi]|uniref:uncharacterized protein LOC142143198 n=1 Tax=Mixophyes fleayi TaxID=3061075 RepID=UPI003F4D8888
MRKEVLSHLRKHRLYCKLEKCIFEVPQILFLSFLVSGEGLQMDPAKVLPISNWPQTQGLKAIQRFVGFANYYMQFIKGFSTIMALTRRSANPKSWPPDAVTAFHTLKKAFFSSPVLSQPDQQRPFFLEVDAFYVGIRAVLIQKTNSGTNTPCGFS